MVLLKTLKNQKYIRRIVKFMEERKCKLEYDTVHMNERTLSKLTKSLAEKLEHSLMMAGIKIQTNSLIDDGDFIFLKSDVFRGFQEAFEPMKPPGFDDERENLFGAKLTTRPDVYMPMRPMNILNFSTVV